MRIIYIEPDENIRDLYSMKLEADFSADIIAVENCKAAFDYVKNHKKEVMNLVLLDQALVDSDFVPLYQLACQECKVPFVTLFEENLNLDSSIRYETDHHGNRSLKKPIQADVFRKTLTDALNASTVGLKWIKRAEHGHNRVKISNFLKFNALPCDAFIRLGEEKFIKLINANDMYTGEVIQRYILKNVQHLYVRQEDYPVLANIGIQTLISLYDRKSEGGAIQNLQLSSLENIHSSIQDIGLTKDAAELTKKTIVSSVQLAKKVKSIAHLLSSMKDSGNYIYDHSLKLSYICTAIAKHTEWGSDATVFKLSLASMMHDMTLENPDLARIQYLKDPNLKNYDESLIEIYRNHPLEAAKLIKESKEFPPDVDFIVAQHHERPDGSGFPRGLSKLRIAPMAALFILAHEFVTKIENLDGVYNKENRDKVYDELNQEMYTLGNFKKPFQGLQKAFNKMVDE